MKIWMIPTLISVWFRLVTCHRITKHCYLITIIRYNIVQGWRLLSQFPPIFSALSNHTLAIEYHVYIWQVSPQLSCGDTCQIWMWFEESNMCFCQVENFAYGEINERSFSNPHPRDVRMYVTCCLCTVGISNTVTPLVLRVADRNG